MVSTCTCTLYAHRGECRLDPTPFSCSLLSPAQYPASRALSQAGQWQLWDSHPPYWCPMPCGLSPLRHFLSGYHASGARDSVADQTTTFLRWDGGGLTLPELRRVVFRVAGAPGCLLTPVARELLLPFSKWPQSRSGHSPPPMMSREGPRPCWCVSWPSAPGEARAHVTSPPLVPCDFRCRIFIKLEHAPGGILESHLPQNWKRKYFG